MRLMLVNTSALSWLAQLHRQRLNQLLIFYILVLADLMTMVIFISRTVDVDIEWREVGTDDWTVISVSKTATTRDELGDTITISSRRWYCSRS